MLRFFVPAIFFISAGFLSPLAAFAQDLNTSLQVDGERIDVRLEARTADCLKKKQFELGKLICVSVAVSSPNAAMIKDLKLASFDAQMPEHRHGMVTRAKIRDSKTGEYLIEGVKLHMPGEWQFELKFVHGKSAAQVAIPLKL